MNGSRFDVLARTTQGKETIMHIEPFQSPRYLPHGRPGRWPGARPRIISGVLAALLMVTAATPAFAGTPHHGRDGGRHEQQEHELSAAGKRDGKRKTVKKTVSSDQAIAIPAEDAGDEFGPADPYPSTINVKDFKKGKITDLNLTLRGFTHTFPGDVDLLLVAPDGRNAVVMGEVSDSTGVEDLTITLDDEAATPLPIDEALTSGSFQPLDQFSLGDPDSHDLDDFPAPAPTPSGDTALSIFDGSNPNGQWRLFINDDQAGDRGTLSDGWELTIAATTRVKAKNKKNTHKPKRRHER